MVEVALEDGVVRQNVAAHHGFVHAPRHLEHAFLVARVYYQVEDITVEEVERLLLALGDDLEELIRAE